MVSAMQHPLTFVSSMRSSDEENDEASWEFDTVRAPLPVEFQLNGDSAGGLTTNESSSPTLT